MNIVFDLVIYRTGVGIIDAMMYEMMNIRSNDFQVRNITCILEVLS